MKRTINQTHIEGLLYQHNLELKTTGEKSKNPGTQYIAGTIDIATDNALTNIVSVHFTYVTAVTSTGKTNDTYHTLKNIIDKVYGTVMADGADKATKLRVDSAIGLNEFFTERDGKEELVSAKRNEGGFIHVVANNDLNPDENARNTFKCDMIITGYTYKEGNEERNIPEKGVIKGCIFNFRNEMLPVEFSAINPNAMSYFEDLEASQSNPIFTQVWGRQISETVVNKKVTESAFGEASVTETRFNRKDFIITGAAKEPYVWDDESSITATEFKEIIAKREVALAAMKQQREEYKASKANAISPAAPAVGGFKF